MYNAFIHFIEPPPSPKLSHDFLEHSLFFLSHWSIFGVLYLSLSFPGGSSGKNLSIQELLEM